MEKTLSKLALREGDISKLIVTYSDMNGMHGGLTLKIHGDGTILQEAVRVSAGTPKELITPNDILGMVDYLILNKAWQHKTIERQTVPDENRVTLTIAHDETSTMIWEWFNDMEHNKRIISIKKMMQKIAWRRSN